MESEAGRNSTHGAIYRDLFVESTHNPEKWGNFFVNAEKEIITFKPNSRTDEFGRSPQGLPLIHATTEFAA